MTRVVLYISILVLWAAVRSQAVDLSAPNYREGFGKDATGGAGKPTYLVTSAAATGPGTLWEAMGSGARVGERTIVFAVDTVTLPFVIYLASNITIDGLANGRNGVTMDATAQDGVKRDWMVEDPASNILIRGINFRGGGTPNNQITHPPGAAETDLLSLDGTNGGSISNVCIDRCTFMRAADGAVDITGNVSNVTVQRCLFYENAKTMLVKYGTRQNISLHHNVYTHNGERNPQIKGNMRLLDFVNNVLYINAGDVTNYGDGTTVDAYGVRIWNANSGSDSPGNVTVNVTACAHMGNAGNIQLITDSGASAAGVYIGSDNYFSPSSNGTPQGTANSVPVAYAVTALPVNQLKSQLLPFVGAPNRTTLDQQRIDAVAAVLPGTVTLAVLRSDFNGDRKADILFRHPSTGQVFLWLMK